MYINYRLQNLRGEMLMFTPKKARCSNHYEGKCIQKNILLGLIMFPNE